MVLGAWWEKGRGVVGRGSGWVVRGCGGGVREELGAGKAWRWGVVLVVVVC